MLLNISTEVVLTCGDGQRGRFTGTIESDDLPDGLGFYAVEDYVAGAGHEMAVGKDVDVFLQRGLSRSCVRDVLVLLYIRYR